MNRSIRKTFQKKPKGPKGPLWEEALANLNALVKKNPETVDEKKMNVLVSAMIELQQEYRASVVQCEKLKGKVAELTKEVEDKDQLLQERSLQIEAAHFRISGLTYLERAEKENQEEEKKSDEDDEDEQHGEGANDVVEIRSEASNNNDKMAGAARRPPRPEDTRDIAEGNYLREKLNHNNRNGMGAPPMARNGTPPWQPPYFGNPVKEKMDIPSSTTDRSLSPSSVQDIALSHVVEMVETLEI